MKKSLLFSSALLLGAFTMSAEVPESLYLTGLNGQTEQTESNLFVLQERDEEDIDDGMWRWRIDNIEVTEETGTITIVGRNGFKLGFNNQPDEEGNVYENMLSVPASAMIMMLEEGPALNYNLAPGEYSFDLMGMEDYANPEEGVIPADGWMLWVRSLSGGGTDTENFYLIGFNGVDAPATAARFVKVEDEEGGISYTLPKFYVESCEAGFTVLDGINGITYGGMGTDVTAEEPMAMMTADGEPVKCDLPAGYYDVNFVLFGDMGMIAFLGCEDQTPNEELEYYLVGLNGSTGLQAEYKFTRNEETMEYPDEETGEMMSYTTLTYVLDAEVSEASELTVVSADGKVVYGYNADMAAVFPNNLNNDMPMALMSTNGDPVNCVLEAGKYTFNFALTSHSTGMLSALPNEDGAVGEIEIDGDVAPVYYDLQGRRVQNPAKGIFIEKRGAKVSKVIR